MSNDKVVRITGIRLKLATAGLALAALSVGVALPAATHAFEPVSVAHTTHSTVRLLPVITDHVHGSTHTTPVTFL